MGFQFRFALFLLPQFFLCLTVNACVCVCLSNFSSSFSLWIWEIWKPKKWRLKGMRIKKNIRVLFPSTTPSKLLRWNGIRAFKWSVKDIFARTRISLWLHILNRNRMDTFRYFRVFYKPSFLHLFSFRSILFYLFSCILLTTFFRFRNNKNENGGNLFEKTRYQICPCKFTPSASKLNEGTNKNCKF